MCVCRYVCTQGRVCTHSSLECSVAVRLVCGRSVRVVVGFGVCACVHGCMCTLVYVWARILPDLFLPPRKSRMTVFPCYYGFLSWNADYRWVCDGKEERDAACVCVGRRRGTLHVWWEGGEGHCMCGGKEKRDAACVCGGKEERDAVCVWCGTFK